MFESLRDFIYSIFSSPLHKIDPPPPQGCTYKLGGDNEFDKITDLYLSKLGYEIQDAWVKEWTSALQLGCPYCDRVQTNSTALDVMHIPPDYWRCEYDDCKKIIGVLRGRIL